MAEEQKQGLGYAFSWLTAEGGNGMFEAVKAQMQAANPIFGELKLEPCKGLTEFPQGFASAWSRVETLTGMSYKPIHCAAKLEEKDSETDTATDKPDKEKAKGIIYVFIAEQTNVRTGERHIVTIGINEYQGNYTPVNGSIVNIF